MKKTLYEILDVHEDAPHEDIISAYKKLARKYHPDVVSGQLRLKGASAEELERAAQEARKVWDPIQQAYDVLSDPDKRAEYEGTSGSASFDSFLQDIMAGVPKHSHHRQKSTRGPAQKTAQPPAPPPPSNRKPGILFCLLTSRNLKEGTALRKIVDCMLDKVDPVSQAHTKWQKIRKATEVSADQLNSYATTCLSINDVHLRANVYPSLTELLEKRGDSNAMNIAVRLFIKDPWDPNTQNLMINLIKKGLIQEQHIQALTSAQSDLRQEEYRGNFVRVLAAARNRGNKTSHTNESETSNFRHPTSIRCPF